MGICTVKIAFALRERVRARNKVVVDVCQTCDLYISRVKRQMEEKEAEYVCGSHISYFTVLKNGH